MVNAVAVAYTGQRLFSRLQEQQTNFKKHKTPSLTTASLFLKVINLVLAATRKIHEGRSTKILSSKRREKSKVLKHE